MNNFFNFKFKLNFAFRSYVFLIGFAILTISNVSQSAIVLNNKNVIEIYTTQSTKPKEIENLLNSNQSVFEQIDLKYNLTTTLDLSKQNDQTDSLSTTLQQNNDTNKYTWLLSKRFLTGTTLGLELTHLDNQYGTIQSVTARTETNQNYFSVNIDQPLFPNFFGSQERSLYNSMSSDYELKKMQTELDQLTSQKDALTLFWKTKSLAKSVEENSKLITEYEKLAQKVQQKKQNQFATAGELEQALSEYETRKQNLKDDKSKLTQGILDLKILLNINEDIQFDATTPETKPIQFSEIKIESLKKYKIQSLKLKSANEQSNSVTSSNLPQLSLYGKYTQSGFDPSNSTAFDEAKDSNYRKYLIGLKLDYIFDNDKSNTDQKIKMLAADIERQKTDRTNTDLNKQIQLAQTDLQTSFDNISTNIKILEYRKKAVADISKNYFQGRTDISFLIDAYNKKNLAEINLINSYGDFETKKIDYQILTLE